MKYDRIIRNFHIRGRGCCHRVVMRPVHGQGILSTIVQGASKLARKHITGKNMKKGVKVVGRLLKSKGKELLNKHKEKAIASASDFATNQTKKIFADLQKGKKPKSVVQDTRGDFVNQARSVGTDVMKVADVEFKEAKKQVKTQVKKQGRKKVDDLISRNNQALLSNILMGNGLTPPKKLHRGSGLMYV